MSGDIISFRNLQVTTIGNVPVPLLDEVSLDVAEGEVVALIGESGAGKSTLGLAGLGYVRAGCRFAGGRVVFEGSDLATLRSDGLRTIRGRRVAYVAQSAAAAFNPSIRIIDQIVESALVHGYIERCAALGRALELARRMALPGVEELVRRFPHELSGGQLQRLMIVMALMCRPALLVLDEPTTAIDVTTQLEVLITLKHIIGQEKVACLYISHDLAVVAQLADRILVLRNGKIVESGATREILTAPRTDYTRDLIAAAVPAATPKAYAIASDSNVILEVRDAGAAYRRGVSALRGVSLMIRAGECIAVIGESGSGKSTLARVITGLLPASKGELIHCGLPLDRSAKMRSKQQLRRIQLVLQQPDLALNPRLKIGQTIGRPLQLFFGLAGRELSERIDGLLRLVELPEQMADRYPSQLSGGQKQRVNLARALAAEPDLLICDEVTSALDTIVSAKILALLAALRERTGAACIFITHDVSKAAMLVDSLYVMHRGEIVDHGMPRALLTSPQHAYTRRLVRSVPELRVDWLNERMEEAYAEDT